MKTRRFMSLAAIAILLTLLMPMSAKAANSRIYFAGTQTGCDELVPSWDLLSGPNYHIHVESQTCYETASIAQVTGTDYLYDGVINFVRGGLISTVTGKFRLETTEGGTWVGTFVYPANTTIIRGVGHGEGAYQGQHIHIFLDDAAQSFWGYIDTGG